MKLDKINETLKLITCILLGVIIGLVLEIMLNGDLKTEAKEVADIRVMCGNYYDYQVIETVDGNIWQIDCEYDEGQLVQVMFNTKGTETVIDDEIINIKVVE